MTPLSKATLAGAALLSAALLLPAAAEAATQAKTTTGITLRAGPSGVYPKVAFIPRNSRITVYGCVKGFSWCDVSWRNSRGWTNGSYLNVLYKNRYQRLPGVGFYVGLPFLTFSFNNYWDNYYPRMSFFRDRDHFDPRHHKDGGNGGMGNGGNGGNQGPNDHPNCGPNSHDPRCDNQQGSNPNQHEHSNQQGQNQNGSNDNQQSSNNPPRNHGGYDGNGNAGANIHLGQNGPKDCGPNSKDPACQTATP